MPYMIVNSKIVSTFKNMIRFSYNIFCRPHQQYLNTESFSDSQSDYRVLLQMLLWSHSTDVFKSSAPST